MMGFGAIITSIGLGTLIYAAYIGVPTTMANRMAWGIPLVVMLTGFMIMLGAVWSAPSYLDSPNILRLTSRPIPQ